MNSTERDERILQRLLSLQPGKIDLGLDRMKEAIRSFCPQLSFQIITIAGTNGKGSTAAFLESLLLAHGRQVGVYTSPHLVHVRERFRIGGTPIAPDALEEEVGHLFSWLESASIQLTYFEAVTLLALRLFEREGVDVAVMEVGLGGRLDATNALEPDITIITSLALDHTEWLGDTLEQIAWEKGGITRAGIPLITGMDPQWIPHALKNRGVPSSVRVLSEDFSHQTAEGGMTFRHGDEVFQRVSLGLLGAHQRDNAALAIEAFRVLEEPGKEELHSAISHLAHTRHAGRLERVGEHPEVLLDGAHNDGGAMALASYLKSNPVEGDTVLITALKSPRSPESLFPYWTDIVDHWCLVELPDHPMVPIQELEQALEQIVPLWRGEATQERLRYAREAAGRNGRVVVAGSLYLVGALRGLLSSTLD